MVAPLGTLLDPTPQETLLRLVEVEMGLWRRHDVIGIRREDPLHELRSRRITRFDDPGAILPGLEETLALVEPELGLAGLVIGSVAEEAAIREQRSDLEIEVDPLVGSRRPNEQGHRGQDPTESRRDHGVNVAMMSGDVLPNHWIDDRNATPLQSGWEVPVVQRAS